jgi:hypothetical protein
VPNAYWIGAERGFSAKESRPRFSYWCTRCWTTAVGSPPTTRTTGCGAGAPIASAGPPTSVTRIRRSPSRHGATTSAGFRRRGPPSARMICSTTRIWPMPTASRPPACHATSNWCPAPSMASTSGRRNRRCRSDFSTASARCWVRRWPRSVDRRVTGSHCEVNELTADDRGGHHPGVQLGQRRLR